MNRFSILEKLCGNVASSSRLEWSEEWWTEGKVRAVRPRPGQAVMDMRTEGSAEKSSLVGVSESRREWRTFLNIYEGMS